MSYCKRKRSERLSGCLKTMMTLIHLTHQNRSQEYRYLNLSPHSKKCTVTLTRIGPISRQSRNPFTCLQNRFPRPQTRRVLLLHTIDSNPDNSSMICNVATTCLHRLDHPQLPHSLALRSRSRIDAVRTIEKSIRAKFKHGRPPIQQTVPGSIEVSISTRMTTKTGVSSQMLILKKLLSSYY